MIKAIDRSTIDRTNKSIINIRRIATLARKTKRIQAVQWSESIIEVLDLFRKYCQVNEGKESPTDDNLTFKHDGDTEALYGVSLYVLKELQATLPAAGKKSMAEEYRQVELLLKDVSNYVISKTRKEV